MEHFDIHDHSDVNEEDYASSSERSIPRVCTQHGQSSNTANPTTPDPLVLDNLRTNGCANDIQYFFEKMSEASTCKLCLTLRNADPQKFPSQRTYQYKALMSNTSLHVHIDNFHLLEYLRQIEQQGWPIYVNSVRMALSVGYTVTTLLETLQQPGISIRKLPPPCGSLSQPVASQADGDDLPPFSLSTFYKYLIKFIVSDDQVCGLLASFPITHNMFSRLTSSKTLTSGNFSAFFTEISEM
ncbi:hypothetical protein SCLCIDRAFT_115857 [Scleroderma citrinum Foug A]|uniref:Uncharacterized protein n=1 Tax=Scleroderma citrinum Foug A TaxID=1036808 RepID=A0A0C3E7U5_9AGAM|nr:hypothetical protein SCLCIDRAFT_115857 [Scleroderma citrinum Foug A]